ISAEKNASTSRAPATVGRYEYRLNIWMSPLLAMGLAMRPPMVASADAGRAALALRGRRQLPLRARHEDGGYHVTGDIHHRAAHVEHSVNAHHHGNSLPRHADCLQHQDQDLNGP